MRSHLNNSEVNNILDNKLIFEFSLCLDNNNVKYPQPVVTFEMNRSNTYCVTYYGIKGHTIEL